MATSDPNAHSFVWMFLTGATEPVVAGALTPAADGARGLAFRYANRYLERPDAVSIGPDLPLTDETFPPVHQHHMPSSIRDAMPDTWGRRAINRELGMGVDDELPDVRYMLESGSDRVGAIDFQASPVTYLPRGGGGALEAVADGAVLVDEDEAGPQLTRAVRNALSAAGGSQPKAYVQQEGREWLAKLQTPYDRQSPLVKAERAALHIARHAGIDVPDARLVKVDGQRLALLTERFDRVPIDGAEGFGRRMVLSGMTIADDHALSGASYPNLVDKARKVSAEAPEMGRELFRRLAFRISMRIDDDHLRNVAFFWDGKHAAFTPAFDLSPDLAAKRPFGLTDLGDGTREFSLAALIGQHRHYHLSRKEAESIADEMVGVVIDHRLDAAEMALMTERERSMLVAQTATSELRGTRPAVSISERHRRHPELKGLLLGNGPTSARPVGGSGAPTTARERHDPQLE
ncbi:HipA domain-containing protein [Microbacterium oryzae]|uniref:type II toxin-antitoxin system HipA family toxin n=1 Tax=Microbacterium oryzae TaxID=743009 RepID=UPI0025AFFF23|nr:HipA domain-containing protein [Microbacterium oryzae]MDN3311776.1 HipA domain-containing protein [Microbacterium oryzae]